MRKIALIALLLAGCAVKTPEPLWSINQSVNAHPYESGFICKQYVDAKYKALAEAGIPATDMTVLYGFTDGGQQHVVLEVIYQGKPFILDNRYDYVTRSPDMVVSARIKPASADWAYVLSGPHY